MICQQAPGEWRILKIHKGNLYFRLTPDWQLLFMSSRQFPWLGLLETWNIYVQLFCLTVSKCDVLNLFIFMINFMSYLLWDVFCLFNFDFIDIPKNIHKRFSPQHLTCDMSKETETIFELAVLSCCHISTKIMIHIVSSRSSCQQMGRVGGLPTKYEKWTNYIPILKFSLTNNFYLNPMLKG